MGLDTDTADALRAACGGAFHVPGEPGYDAGRRVRDDACDQRPAAVSYPADADEVAAILRIAAAAGLRVAPQLTGRQAATLGSLDDAILMRLAGLRGVTVDVPRRAARIGAGVLWLDVVSAAARHGLTAAHPWAGNSGVVGHCLDAGTGPYSRLLGLAAGAVIGAEIVTPDGQRHQLAGDEELLWMLRGGSGGGVVTSLDLRLAPISRVYAGSLRWPGSRAGEVLERWVEWCSSAPEEVTTRCLFVPDIGDQAGFRVQIDGLVAAEESAAARALAGLRAAGPVIDTFVDCATDEAAGLFSPSAAARTVLSGLPPAARAVVSTWTAGDLDGGLEISQLGAAARRPSRREGVRTWIDGEFVLAGRGAEALADELRPWSLPLGPQPEVMARLSALRSRIDPAALLVSAPLGS